MKDVQVYWWESNGIIVPLKAVVSGEPVIGPDLSGEEWTELKSRLRKGLAVTIGCCGAPGHVQVSRSGTQHFYHAVDACCTYTRNRTPGDKVPDLPDLQGRETFVEFPATGGLWSQMSVQPAMAECPIVSRQAFFVYRGHRLNDPDLLASELQQGSAGKRTKIIRKIFLIFATAVAARCLRGLVIC